MTYDLFNKPMHKNSLDNWYNQVLPTLTEWELAVLTEIKQNGKGSCRAIAERMNVFPHTISGRFTKLKEKNAIKSCGNEIINDRKHEVFDLNYEISEL